ncbi:AraC family transcriptional regulator [Pseudactinotalea sp. Z1739]|uniref:helix-turn-helix transcriptional regulator n=1 Tax=Pseudactinotalea sp. Z1739 TaxID=3413028 RepID=UPI003C7EC3BD
MAPHREPNWAAYLSVSRALRDGSLSCRGAGEQTGFLRHTRARRRLATHALVFVTEGSGQFAGTDGRRHSVQAPAVMWLFPGVPHDYGPDRQGWREHWVLFEGISARAMESVGAWSQSVPVAPARTGLHEDIAPSFAKLRSVLATPNERAALIAATTTHHLIGVAAEAVVSVKSRADSVIETMMASAFVQMSVVERAQQLGLTEDALRAHVLEATGLSPHEFIIQVRISRAQVLLAETPMSVSAVARQVGYDDPGYFSRLFRCRVGVPPLTFRRQEARDSPAMVPRAQN